LNATMETNILLMRLINVVSTRGQGPRVVSDRPTARGVDQRTRELAQGGD